ncbi:hypothetical protein BpHYR1_008695 [Brachionus plicatilis]|uniref:Uncharacterized protein n=1 Tax=Brachionus plicatilis TaxID=10195 RepID=A0A3M7RWD8_BRAPC|nr:hypothetical protein BpHYR1_008695 [Brachionus plicatilis]
MDLAGLDMFNSNSQFSHEKHLNLSKLGQFLKQECDQEQKTAQEIKSLTENWLETFLTIYHRSDVTPYIHAFVNHLHDLSSMSISWTILI